MVHAIQSVMMIVAGWLLGSLGLVAIAQTPDSSGALRDMTADSPVYTTYAAAPERSEFTLDEGYHFRFSDPDLAPAFTTDNAGDWCLGFRMGPRYVEAVKDLARPPILTASYPDLVQYRFSPFDSLRVDATFLVHSSHLAVQHLIIRNERSSVVSVEVLPFLRNSYRAFTRVERLAAGNGFAFSHEELPDDWTVEHAIPYVKDVHDIFLMSDTADRCGSFLSYRWGDVQIPQEFALDRKQGFLVWGRIVHAGGEPCRHRPTVTTLTVMPDDDARRMLTESAPRWGSAESNITDYGYYGVELANLQGLKTGEHFTIHVRCEATGEESVIRAVVGDTSAIHDLRQDVRLESGSAPEPPREVRRDIWGSGTELRLYWRPGPPDVTYRVYRRDYLSSGEYDLLGDGITHPFFTDKNLPDGKVFGYVVVAVNRDGRGSAHSNEVNNIEGSDFLTDVKYPGQVKGDAKDLVRVISMAKTFRIVPGTSVELRIVRGVRRPEDSAAVLLQQCTGLLHTDLASYAAADRQLMAKVPPLRTADPGKSLLYTGAFTLMRQVMLPPEGKSHFNYYVFSREPQWGWGHGGQVFHESLSMLAYALMDPTAAMNSQRVYRERQAPDGYINYRTGPYLDETIPTNGQRTTSAPWYAWTNWELYEITQDRTFLEEMYESSARFYRYYVGHRDADGDGLCEWGGDGVLESVRDARVAVWDQVGPPDEFEALDLNCMLVKEARSLASMAGELGKPDEATRWTEDADERSRKINSVFWDDSTGFYYHVTKKEHSSSFKHAGDLKRREIIGFLPLWAGVADSVRARRLVDVLTDTSRFWRRYGVPSLAADDLYYNPEGYWNGPVWVEWNYLIERGLLDYGYRAEAKELVDHVAANMIAQLKNDHTFWEFYSPDDQWGGYHQVYIWAGMIAAMMRLVAE